MRNTRWIAVLVTCIFAMSIPAFAQLPSSGWPKYQRDAYNSGRSPATLIAKPVVSWTYSLGFMPSVTGLSLDGSGYCYIMSTGPSPVVKIAPDGTAASGWSWTAPNIVGSAVTTSRNGATLFDNGTSQMVLTGPGRSATTNAKTYAGNMSTGTMLWTTPFAYTDYYSATSNTYTNPAVGEDGSIYTHTQGTSYATVDESGPLFALNSDGTYKWTYNSFTVGGTTYANGIGGCNGTFPVMRIPASGGVPAHNRIFVSGGERYAYWQARADRHKYQVYAVDDMGTYGDLVWGAFCENNFGPASISNDGNTLYVGGSDNWGSYATPYGSPYPNPAFTPALCSKTLFAYDTNTGGASPIDAYKGTGEAKWSLFTGSQHIHPPAIGADGTLYLSATGAVSTANGTSFDESFKYFNNYVGRVIAVTDHGTYGSIKWTLDLPDDSWSDTSNIVVASTDPQVLYVGTGKGRLTTGGRVYAIADMGDHAEILWTYQGISDSANAWPRYLALNDNGDLFVEFGKYVKKFAAGTGFDTNNANGISGYVKDADGNPIANAWVVASASASPTVYDSERYRAKTNSEGYYQIGLVSAGTYYIAATAPGYNATTDDTVTLSTTADVVKKNFTLAPAGFDWAIAADVTCPNYLTGYPPTRAVDGNTSSLFAIPTSKMPATFTIDLGAARTIDEAAFYWEQGWSKAFTIDCSDDGSTWTNVKTATNNNGGFTTDYYLSTTANKNINTAYPYQKWGYQVVKFAPQTARYWRLYTTSVGGTGSNLTIWELELRDSTMARQPLTIAGAKNTPEGGGTSISNAVVTATPGGGVPTDTIFIETADRSAGIKVHMASMPATIQFGDKVSIAGKVYTANDEKYIEATSITRTTTTTCPDGPALAELSMNNKAAQDTVSQGLFIKTWGKVSNSTTGSFMISDGTATPIKVLCTSTVALPVDGDYVRVRGFVGKDANGPVLYMRNERVDWAYASDDMHALPFTGSYDYPIQYLVLGPFTDSSKTLDELLDYDFIGEATVAPAEGIVTAGKSWFKATSTNGVLDINSAFGGTTTYAVAYVHLYVWSETDGPDVALATGSDNSLKYFINNIEAFRLSTTRSCTIGSEYQGITLHQGVNSILFKVINDTGEFKLSSQIIDSVTFGGPGYGGYSPYVTTGLGYSLNPSTP